MIVYVLGRKPRLESRWFTAHARGYAGIGQGIGDALLQSPSPRRQLFVDAGLSQYFDAGQGRGC